MKKDYFKIALLFFVTVGAVIFGLNWLYGGKASPKPRAAGKTMNLTFNPATKTAGVNTEFTVSLRAKPSDNTQLRGYKTKVGFDKTKLEFKSITYNFGRVTSGLGNTASHSAAINNRGYINVIGEVASAVGGSMTKTAQTKLTTITFKVKATGGNNVTTSDSQFFTIAANKSLISNWGISQGNLSVNGGGPTNTPTPTITPGGPTLTPTPTGGVTSKVNLKLKFQGITKQPSGNLNSMRVKVRLYNENTERFIDADSANFTSNASGVWSGQVDFSGVRPAHKYTILVKGPYHIQKKVCEENPNETYPGSYRCIKGRITLKSGVNNFDLSKVLLMTGDLPNQDGVVNSTDTSLIRNNLGKTDADAVAKADVNRDGRVDTQDWSLVIGALSIRQDEL